jgi:hypothetical protein
MNWFLLAFLGTMLNGAGLCFFAQSIIRKTLEPGALNAYLWYGLIGLILINAGICLIVEAAKRKGR